MLSHVDVALRMGGVFSELIIVELLLMLIGIEDSLKAFTVSIRVTRPSLIKLDISLYPGLCSSLIVILVNIGLNLVQIFL